MSLTEEWKLGKKKFGHYYYKDKNGDECIARWWELNPAISASCLKNAKYFLKKKILKTLRCFLKEWKNS